MNVKDFRVKGAYFKQYIIVSEVLFCRFLLSTFVTIRKKKFRSRHSETRNEIYYVFYRFYILSENGTDKLHSFTYALLNILLVCSNIKKT